MKWTTRDGAEMSLSEMQTTHIQNCILMLKRRIDSGDTMYVIGDVSGAPEDRWAEEVDGSNELRCRIDELQRELSRRSINRRTNQSN